MNILNIMIMLAIATLSGMGVGGGGLLVIYLTLARGCEQIGAQQMNLIFFLCSAAASVAISARRGAIHWKLTLPMSVAGALTTVIGTLVAQKIDPSLLRTIFGAMLSLSGASSLLSALHSKKRSKRKL